MNTLPFKKLHPDAKITRGSEHAAGYDLYATEGGIITETVAKFKTGLAVEIPPGYVGLIRDRSSMGAKAIIVCGGVVDSDYRGEILVCLIATNRNGSQWHPIAVGDKIAQLVIVPCFQGQPQEVDSLSDTVRGEKGFGQLTGK